MTKCSARHTCNAWARVRQALWPQWWIGVQGPIGQVRHDRGRSVSDAGKRCRRREGMAIIWGGAKNRKDLALGTDRDTVLVPSGGSGLSFVMIVLTEGFVSFFLSFFPFPPSFLLPPFLS